MSSQLELDWLSEERPAPLPLDPGTTARVRAELLDAGGASTRRSGLRFGGRWMRRLELIASTATLAAVAGVALLASGSATKHPAPGHAAVGVAHHGRPSELSRLSLRLASATAPIGDATLVLRTQSYPSSPAITGADLYADNGDYYYSPTLSGLPSLIQAHETVNSDASDQEVRDIAAAKAALTEPIDQARQQMSIANLDPGVKMKAIYPGESAAQIAADDGKIPAAVEQKLEEVQRNAAAQDIQSVISQEDGMIWDNGMDALLAGAGDPQVRAGVLKLYATIPQIAVTNGTLNGQPTLVLTASLISSKSGLYQEQLILNADTGIPLEMIGGNEGQTPSVTVDYTISRVTVASIENGSYTG